ncbi:MAG: hypothetical protein L7U70_01065 [Flavobacteriales bacterium]|nr:hypothetical protein [Flavobacteriales bacterium]
MDKLKDHMLLGVFIGALVPVSAYFILVAILGLVSEDSPLRDSTMQVIALFINFPLFRTFLTKYKKDRLGRGMLLSTFLFAIWYIVSHEMLVF